MDRLSDQVKCMPANLAVRMELSLFRKMLLMQQPRIRLSKSPHSSKIIEKGLSVMTALSLCTHYIDYQITIRLSFGTYSLSPSFVWNASWKASKLMIGPTARYCAGECGSVFTWLTTYSSVVLERQIVAHDKKKRCSWVYPSINPGYPLSFKYICKASNATEEPPKSPIFSTKVKRPLTNTPGTGS